MSTYRATPEPRLIRRVLFYVEWTERGPRVSHCVPSEALAEVAAEEMRDKTPANLPELAMRQLQDWMYSYGHGEWSREAAR